jgi:Peptidase family M23
MVQRSRLLALLVLAVLFLAVFAGVSGVRGHAQDKTSKEENEKGLEGTWEGVLGGRLHLSITFTKTGEGAYTGVLKSIDQGSTLVVQSAAAHGDAVEFEVKAIQGHYKGVFIREDEIQGTWTQAAAPTPQSLALKRTSAPQAPASAPNAVAPNPAERRLPTPKPFSAPLDVSIPVAPWAFEASGKWQLVYELHVANLSRFDCRLMRVEVVAADPAHKSLANFEGADLASLITEPGKPDSSDTSSIAPGSIAIIFLWVTVDSRDAVPWAIAHRISMRIGDYPEALMIETPPLEVNRQPVAAIAPPLRGSDWVAANGPSNTSHHRRALIAINGRSFISQRFATDWVQIGSDGETHTGDPADNKNYHAYGAEIRAVAGGLITEVKDGLPQNVPGANSRAIPITLDTVGGNHVIEQIGDTLFAFYAHIQPGSIPVKVGDRVQRGQLLGLVGNSGNSTEPHLHFDICDSSSMLACEGLPFSFASYQLEGHGEDFNPKNPAGPPVTHQADLPLEFDIVHFPD